MSEINSDLVKDIPILEDVTYLDNAGASLFTKTQVENATKDLLQNLVMNPHSSPEVAEKIDAIRGQILEFVNADSDEYSIVFTSGATAALKIVAECFPWEKSSRFAYVQESHTSVVGMRKAAFEKGIGVNCFANEEELELKIRLGLLDIDDEVPNLLVLPAMSNFCGQKYKIELIQRIQKMKNWLVMWDTASYASTNPVDLKLVKPDFICLSFYKIFGYPSGIGALVAKKDSLEKLRKCYFGGGTVETYLLFENSHVPRRKIEEFFEDGTLPYQQILALEHGFKVIKSFTGGMSGIAEHTFKLAQIFYQRLEALLHANGVPLAEIYCAYGYNDISKQGGIVNFNLLRNDGSHFGFNAFKRIADLEKVIVRVGCFCNIGSCQKYLGYDDKDTWKRYQDGHVCGDDIDLIDGNPVGSIRISFGFYSRIQDVEKVIELLERNFLNVENEIHDTKLNVETFLSGIQLYPIKSCAPMIVQEWEMTRSGLKYDRNWAIMKGDQCLTQKKLRALCLLQPTVDERLQILRLEYPKMPSIEIPIHQSSAEMSSSFNICLGKVCNESMEGFEYGQEVSDWLEEALGEDNLRLVRRKERTSKAFHDMSLANVAPYLILNKTSADEVLRRAQDQFQDINHNKGCQIAEQAIWQHRNTKDSLDTETLLLQFRGNLIIEGAAAFAEDNWNQITFTNDEGSSVVLNKHEKCSRCSMIGIDQRNADVIRGLVKTLAYMTERGFTFGILFKHTDDDQFQSFKIKVGQTVGVK